jgi:hypothetical protein
MYNAYHNCYNLNGSPACGNNVISMAWAYWNCQNLTGNPVCGPNVTSMVMAYYNCRNLTGAPACGNSVISMASAYYKCENIKGQIIIGPNVTTLNEAFYMAGEWSEDGSKGLHRDIYIYSKNITNIRDWITYAGFDYTTGDPEGGVRVYVPANSITFNTFKYGKMGSSYDSSSTLENYWDGALTDSFCAHGGINGLRLYGTL